MVHKILFYLFFLAPFLLCGQTFSRTSSFLYKSEARVLDIGSIKLSEIPATAIVIKSEQYHGSAIEIIVDTDTLSVPLDPDSPSFTYFLSLPKSGSIEILIEDQDTFQLFLINSGTAPEVESSFRIDAQNECISPINAIPQSEWRAGLPDPDYSRINTEVEHLVVHHSAGSNSNPNYTQVVRDIYLYHTEVNGWSDIGYNYLIAQDGSVYNGRDPGSLEQDNVLGAHFCGANSMTMGVCLLGNYETANITPSARLNLQNLLAWKLEKEDLSPYATNQHSLGLLEAIIGHRDGCATLCPGANVYNILGDIKEEVNNLVNCDEPVSGVDFETPIRVVKARSSITYNNLSNGYESYEWIFEGGIPERTSWTDSGTVTYNYPGVFDVTLIGIAEGIRDTLTRRNYVEIQGDPIVFPNPTKSLNQLAIHYHYEVMKAELYSMSGQQLALELHEEGTYRLPYLRPGIYLLKIYTDKEVFGRKISVE